MRNRALAADHRRRALARLAALDALHEAGSWADVVRESQEVVELALKGLLYAAGIAPPRVHDVSPVLAEHRERLPPGLDSETLARLMEASRELRKDRELAFYGGDDLTPSDYYAKPDADRARESARLAAHTAGRLVPDED